MQGVQQQFHADEEQDERQPLGQIHQPLKQIAEQEVQLAQTHQREDVGREHQIRLAGQSVDRRDGVHREQQIGGTQGDDHQEHRGHQPLVARFDVQLQTVPGIGGVQVGLGEANDGVIGVIGVVGVAGQFDRRQHQKRAEDVEDPGELLDRHGTQGDEDAAEDQGQHDADEKCLLLKGFRNVEAGHDDDEDEQVVYGQAVFGEPAGVELKAELGAVEVPHPQAEEHSQPDVERQCEKTLAPAGLVRTTGEDQQIGDQDSQRHTECDGPLDK